MDYYTSKAPTLLHAETFPFKLTNCQIIELAIAKGFPSLLYSFGPVCDKIIA